MKNNSTPLELCGYFWSFLAKPTLLGGAPKSSQSPWGWGADTQKGIARDTLNTLHTGGGEAYAAAAHGHPRCEAHGGRGGDRDGGPHEGGRAAVRHRGRLRERDGAARPGARAVGLGVGGGGTGRFRKVRWGGGLANPPPDTRRISTWLLGSPFAHGFWPSPTNRHKTKDTQHSLHFQNFFLGPLSFGGKFWDFERLFPADPTGLNLPPSPK